jgi:hypothetical protein
MDRGPQNGWSAEVSGRKIARVILDTERIKIHLSMLLLKLSFLVDLRQKVGELVLSITSCPSITTSENTLN